MDLSLIHQRRARLENIRQALKVEFFGIDLQIDSIIDSVKTWYLFPDVLERPSICCLWGLTGVGKSALVRSLINHIGFSSKFVEIQMDGISNGEATDAKSIFSILSESSIGEGSPGIILLDEFQRFRTRDGKGNDIKVERFADVWMLLSDGRFPANYSALLRMEERMLVWEYWDDKNVGEEAERQAWSEQRGEKSKVGEELKVEAKYKRKYKNSYADSEDLKKILRCPESIREIMAWPKEKMQNTLKKLIETKDIPPIDYSKCLIFVAGNLDEAYHFAEEVEDCDTNADIYHEYTKKISPMKIKSSLLSRFRPEQVARLGNNHVIYPSLSSEAYHKLVRRSCNEYIDKATNSFNIRFNVDEKVYQEIYENSVYPTQGTRPVFTSIHKMFGSPISDAIFWAKENGFDEINVSLDIKDSCIVFFKNDKECRVHIDLDVHTRRAQYSKDYNALVAVHEAGHAIIYADLFKEPPVEIAISAASFTGGYNRFNYEHLSRKEVLDSIAVGMGGIIAEELIFGEDMRSTGCVRDLMQSTSKASSFVRTYGMDGFKSFIAGIEEITSSTVNNNIDGSNEQIETIVGQQKTRAQAILTKYRPLLVALSKRLINVRKMTSKEFIEFVGNAVDGLRDLNKKDIRGNYASRLETA